MTPTRSLPEGWRTQHFETVGSTMDAAREMAENGAPDGTVIRADEQTGGRGRYGRDWSSPPGNLYLTAILREMAPLRDCAGLSFVAALALAEVVSERLPKGRRLSLKWPNDVLIDGAKIAGVLLEAGGDSEGHWVLLGMGVNIASHPDGTPYPATHLNALGLDIVPDGFFHELLTALDLWRARWRKQGFAPIRASWLTMAHGYGKEVTVRLPDGAMTGVFRDLDEDGALILERENRRHRIAAGDVFFGPNKDFGS